MADMTSEGQEFRPAITRLRVEGFWGVESVGFRVEGLGFRVWGVGFLGSGSGVKGLLGVDRVEGSGFRVEGGGRVVMAAVLTKCTSLRQ